MCTQLLYSSKLSLKLCKLQTKKNVIESIKMSRIHSGMHMYYCSVDTDIVIIYEIIIRLEFYAFFYFLCKYLAMGPIPKNLPIMFNNLSEIYVELCNFPDEIATVLCLFQNAPNLKELHIQVHYFSSFYILFNQFSYLCFILLFRENF